MSATATPKEVTVKSVPKMITHEDALVPTLQVLKKSGPMQRQDLIEAVADLMEIDEGTRSLMLPSGVRPVYSNRLSWAFSFLKKASLVTQPRRGQYEIAPFGEQVLDSNLPSIDVAWLRANSESFEEWVKYCRRPRSASSGGEPGASPGAVESELTPDDALANAHATLQRELASELLEAIHGCSPTFFEHLVVKLLVKMGYGGTFDDAARSLGKSGDGGIDGIIKEDRLGLDAIYIQAKRWQNTVGRPDVQAFVGALTGQRARKGVFITTSSYSREAHAYVQNLDAKVVLIDGEMLTDFMIEVGLGVSLEQTFEVKRIDTDFFDE